MLTEHDLFHPTAFSILKVAHYYFEVSLHFVLLKHHSAPIACTLLDKAGVAYTKLLANENAEMATELGIKTAPTLVVVENGNVSKYAGVSDIKKYIGA